jgi:hypothetical protein
VEQQLAAMTLNGAIELVHCLPPASGADSISVDS